MNAIPQLNEAETQFFESGGRERAPSLFGDSSRRMESAEEAKVEAGESDWTPASAGVTEGSRVTGKEEVTKKEGDTAEKPGRLEKFVPLQALQQERAEKKQLRDELKAYREWQAQLAQRLQQFPSQAAQPAPDPQTKPLDYINHVLGNVQATTAELQQWRQQQEQAAQQQAAAQQTANWAAAQEQEFARTQPEYPEAYRYAAEARDKELQSLGYADPAQRAAIVRQNTAEIVNNALQQGRNPAELVWEYALGRGFAPKAKKGSGNEEAHSKIAAGLQAAGAKLNQGGATGDGELTAKDLAGITDPEEFEKAWKKVFGKRH